MTRKALVLVATTTLALGGVLGAGSASAGAAAAAPRDTVYCTYTTNSATPVHSTASSSGNILYTVPKGSNVFARQTNTGNYKYGSWTSHIDGYMYKTHLYNQRGCVS